MSAEPLRLGLDLAPEHLEAIAARVADLLAARAPATSSPYLTVTEAADYMRCKPPRVHDLCSQGRLPRVKDGARLLVRRADVDAYLAGDAVTPE